MGERYREIQDKIRLLQEKVTVKERTDVAQFREPGRRPLREPFTEIQTAGKMRFPFFYL